MGRPIATTWRCWRIDCAGAAICVALSALAYFAVFRPLAEGRALADEQMHLLSIRRKRVSQLASVRACLTKQMASVSQAVSENRVKLQPAAMVNRRIAELTELFAACGLEADGIKLGEAIEGNRHDIIPISFSGTGGYRNWTAFLRHLHETFPDTAVAYFRIGGNPGKSAAGEFSVRLYWHAARQAKRPAG